MNPAAHQVMLEVLDPLGRRSSNVPSRVFVVGNQIDFGFDSLHESNQSGSVLHGVVEARHHDVFEGDSFRLVQRQVPARSQQFVHAVPFGDGHDFESLRFAGGVEADRNVDR